VSAQTTAELLDAAEASRRRGRRAEAMDAIERVLADNPAEPRALLLKSRLFYQSGSIRQALDDLRPLEAILGQGELAELTSALARLDEDSRRPPAFATESMARLLVQQGYLLEAIEVYRELYGSAADRAEVREEIVRLAGAVEREGSRDADDERVRSELEICQSWLAEHPRGA
jgi:tetratricopeptide (TPR) repeat protein